VAKSRSTFPRSGLAIYALAVGVAVLVTPAALSGATLPAHASAPEANKAATTETAKPAAKGEAAKDQSAKGESAAGKAEAKQDSKSEIKEKGAAPGSSATTVGPTAAGTPKTGEMTGDKAGDKAGEKTGDKAGDKAGEKTGDKPAVAGAAIPPAPPKVRAAGAKPATADEAPAPNTPPLKVSSLRDEMGRSPRREDRPSTHSEREKLELLAGEINKSREGLRQDTARLEALLAARDAAQAAATSAAAAAANDSGDAPKKIPTTLDNLAKAIRGMKPEQAAPIISRVDRKLAADILLRMPGADAGKVLGVCKPEVAADIAAEIASRTPHAELKR
jgi:flagellar motility protein MotE (MotC chaperone)